MKFLDHFRKYAVYRRALLSYLALSALTVLIVSAILLVAYGRETTRDVTESGEAILAQTARAIDVLKDQVRTVGNALIEEETVVASLRSEQVDRVLEYRTNLVFTTFRAVYPFIRFVGLYNGKTDRYVSTEGLTSDGERGFIRHVRNTGTLDFFSSHVRPINYAYPRPGDSNLVVSFVLRPDVRLHTSNESFLLVNVDVEYVRSLVENLSGGYGGPVIVTTENGTLVVRANSEGRSDLEFMDALTERTSSTPRYGERSYGFRDDGSHYIVTTAVAADLGWQLFGIRPRAEILSHSLTLAWLTLGVAALIIVLGAAASAAFASRIYDPLSKLVTQVENAPSGAGASHPDEAPVNEYEVLGRAYRRFASRVGLLEGALHDDLPLRRRSYLHSLMLGARPQLPEPEEIASQVVASAQAPAYTVVVCQPDRARDMQRDRSADVVSNALLLASRTYHDTLSDLGTVTPMLLDGYEIAIVIGCSNKLPPDEIEGRLHEAHVLVGRQNDITMSCGISSPVTSLEQLHDALAQAHRLVRIRFFRGPSSVITPANARPTAPSFVPFPSRLSRRLLEALKLNREPEVFALLDEFERTVRRNSYHGALALYYQLSVEMLSEFETLTHTASEAFTRHRRFVEDLSEVDFATDAAREVESLCRTILQVQGTDMGDKSRILHRMACDHVEAHYANPNLSLDAVAEELNVSSGHLGRVFAERAGLYLSDYITRVRVDHAKELLATTTMTVSHVAESVGVTNPTYFFTLFKKYVGVTPASFRRAATAND